MKRSVTDVKLNVKPVFIGFEHQYYYEGPCRMAGGDAIKPGFDAIVQGKMLKGFLANVQKYVAATGANVLEPAVVCCTDDWDIKDAYFEEMLADEARTDLYVVMSNFGANQVLVEFCCRTSKPVAMNPTKSFGAMSTAPAARRGADILPAFDWPEVARYCRLLRAEKAVRTANILLAPRFDSTTPKAGGNDSFVCLSDVTRKLGCHFRHVNVHELMDMMDPLPEDGNPTTPGRATPNITSDEVTRCEDMADELMAGGRLRRHRRAGRCGGSRSSMTVGQKADERSTKVTARIRRLLSVQRLSTRCLNEASSSTFAWPTRSTWAGVGSLRVRHVSVVCMIAEQGPFPNWPLYMGNTLPVRDRGAYSGP